jgi:hypothetical protein
MRSIVRVTAIFAVATALAAAPAQARDRKISGDTTAANVTAFGQGLAWSRTPAGTQPHLVLRAFGSPTDLSVPPATGGVFDPDLGSNGHGDIVAVYTRCAGLSGRNCDVYEFNLMTRTERKLPGASSTRCSEFAPSVWDGTVAFGRSGPGKCAGLYVKGQRGRALRLDRRIPAETDIRAGRVAYLHVTGRNTHIRLFTIRDGSSRLIATGTGSGRNRQHVSNPTLSGAFLYFLLEDVRGHDFDVGRTRSRTRSGIRFTGRSFRGRVESIAVDGTTLYYTNRRGVYQATDPAPRFVNRG